MQIQRVQNNVNFGYNEQLNKQLVTTVQEAKRNKDFLNTLLKLNTLTNETENLVRQAEKSKKQTLLKDLTDIFIDFKAVLAAYVEDLYPKLNFIMTETATYAEEVYARKISGPEHWLCQTITELLTLNAEDGQRALFAGVKPENMTLEEFMEQHNIDIKQQAEAEEVKEGAAKASENGKEWVKEYIPTESSKKGFAALGGMNHLKALLNDRIVLGLKDPEQAKLDEIEYGKKMPKGILLYGPPGCGKTTIVEHLSTEAGVPLLKLEAGTLGSKYIHETSERIDAAFDYAEARAKDTPVLVFLDDADAMLIDRDSASSDHSVEEMSSFLNRIQKAGENNVIFVAATNKYDLLDEAIKSRFQEQIFVDLPDKEARKSIVKLFMNQRTKGVELANNDEELEKVAEKTEGFPIRAIKMISDKASILALNDGRRNIKLEDFEKVIADSENMKVKGNKYKSKNTRKPIGYNQ